MTKQDFLRYLNQTIQIRRQIKRDPRYKYQGFEDFVLRNGRYYEDLKLSKQEVLIVKEAMKDEVFPGRYCFRNASLLVRNDETRTLVYNEGFATGIIPVLHAWVTINNKVVDVTWTEERFPKGDRHYLGVAFDRIRVKEKPIGASIIDDYTHRWPLLLKPQKQKAV